MRFSTDIPSDSVHRGHARSAAVALVMVAGLALGGCSTVSDWWGGDEFEDDEIVNAAPPEQLFNEGLAELNTGSRSAAADKFDELDKLHPYSDYARRGTLLSAYAYFEAGDYENAIASARRFVTLNPASPDAAYAQFLIGESYFRQITTVDRDQDAAQRTARAMTDLLQRFPDSEYAATARQRLEVAEDQLAGSEMEVGRYYQGRAQYLAAVNRYRLVVSNYQTTRHVEEALLRLTESYLALGVVSEAQTAAAVLGHNFPDSEWYRSAFQALRSDGYEPVVNERSWMARVFNRDEA